MKTINKIVDKARKGLMPILVSTMIGAGVSGCSGGKSTVSVKLPINFIQLCNNETLPYHNLEVLAQAKEGQKLLRIDGEFYIGDEDCITGSKIFAERDEKVSYSQNSEQKILTVSGIKNSIKYVFGKDGSFYKEITVK